MRRPLPSPWFVLAALAGTVHAAFSLWWATGGDLLVDTVGTWAVDWRRSHPLTAGAALVAIGVAKLAGAWAPWVLERRGRRPRGFRALLTGAGTVLALYGLANAVAANIVLTGLLGPPDDMLATRGHAWLWDPLFAVWGAALLAGLWRTRRRRATPQGDPPPRSVSLRRG